MRCFIYSRKSVDTGRGESVENQVEMCREYLAARFPETGAADLIVFEDEGFSAKDTRRPQFQQMLRALRREPPDYVVCYRLDRISRSVSDFSALIEELNARGVSFLCIREEFDTSKPVGKAMMYIASVFAQLERETIAQRVRDNMLLLARTGRWLGGTPPTGFSACRIEETRLEGKVRSVCRLRAIPEELAQVRLMYDSFLALGNLTGVRRTLAERGVQARGGGQYSLPGLREILRNPVYCAGDRPAWDYFNALGAEVCFAPAEEGRGAGLLAYNKRGGSAERGAHRDEEEWVVALGQHPALLPGEQWVRVQRMLAKEAPSAVRNRNALFSGRIFCAFCSARMLAKNRSGRPGQFDYICTRKLRQGAAACECPNLNGPAADMELWRAVCPDAPEPGYLIPVLEELDRRLRAEEADLARERRGAQREMERLFELLEEEGADPALRRAAEERIARLQRRTERQEETGADLGTMARRLADVGRVLGELPEEEKRGLLRQLGVRARWDGTALACCFCPEEG